MAKLSSRQVQLLVSDAITDAIEDLVFKNHLSRKNARSIYRELAKAMQLKDLMERPRPGALKHAIKTRLGRHVKANLPKEEPTKPRRLVHSEEYAG
jgi:hypothetical protein